MNEEIKLRLQQIETANGRLTPEAVVDDARDPDSPLHSWFEWDDKRAAVNFRIEQARALIARVRVEIIRGETKVAVPVYVRDPTVPASQQGYISVFALSKDKSAAATAVQTEFRLAEAALNRAFNVAAALGIEEEVGTVKKQVRKLRDDVAERVAAVA